MYGFTAEARTVINARIANLARTDFGVALTDAGLVLARAVLTPTSTDADIACAVGALAEDLPLGIVRHAIGTGHADCDHGHYRARCELAEAFANSDRIAAAAIAELAADL